MNLVLYLLDENFDKYIKELQKRHQVIFCYEKSLTVPAEEAITEADLPNSNFDYLLIMTKDRERARNVREKLEKRGISSEKILDYSSFELNPAVSPIELFWAGKYLEKYDTLIFGMSHAYGGLLPGLLPGKIYKFAAPSMDLYYHYKVFQDLCSNYDMHHVQKLVFELPYYVFNYDVSMCKNTFRQRINYYYYYGEYHHFGTTEEEKREIVNFAKLNELSEDSIYAVRCRQKRREKRQKMPWWIKKRYLAFRYKQGSKSSVRIWTQEEAEEIAGLRPHVWYKEHTQTISENIEIWENIKSLARERGLELLVCVFPFNPLFWKTHEECIQKAKKTFYDNLRLPPEQIFDGMQQYPDKPEYFSDVCHLNKAGAYEFSKVLARWLK